MPKQFHRQSIRLRGYDYTQPGIYFVTMCTNERYPFFETPNLRRVADRHWESLSARFDYITLNTWVIMPDHMHGLISIRDAPPRGGVSGLSARSLGAIMLTYKSLVTRSIHKQGDFVDTSIWQRGYWERIVRDDVEFNAIRRYIRDNPQREQDNLDTLLARMSFRL